MTEQVVQPQAQCLTAQALVESVIIEYIDTEHISMEVVRIRGAADDAKRSPGRDGDQGELPWIGAWLAAVFQELGTKAVLCARVQRTGLIIPRCVELQPFALRTHSQQIVQIGGQWVAQHQAVAYGEDGLKFGHHRILASNIFLRVTLAEFVGYFWPRKEPGKTVVGP